MPRSAQNVVFILLIGLGWGLLGPGSKVLFAAEPGTFDGITVAVARAAWALPICVIALGVAWRFASPRLDARRWLAVVAAGVLFGPFITVIFSVAAQHTSVAHISFLIGLAPVTNTALAALVFRTALDRRAVIALVLGIVGVALLAATHSGDKSAFLGDVLMIFWLIGFAVYACFLRYVGVRIKPPMLMCLVGTIAMAALLGPGIALGYGGAIGHVADTPSIAWWFFGEVLLGSTLIAQPAFAAAVRRLGVALATIGAEYTALAVGVVASLVAHEAWTPLTVAGGLILCCALAVTFVPLHGAVPRTQSRAA
ncbi:MAG TPA: DMT family transporter [Candidatus Elarobacter sp.]